MERMTVSVEFFPPKDDAGEARLWEASAALESIAPDFISVTYGAGGSTRDRTIQITKEITERTGRNTVAHLTCVGSTKEELVEILAQYRSAGIKSILALRGDPVGHPASNNNLDRDIKVLLRKEELGATFATTQFFFESSKWESLVEKLATRGSKLPIIAGILPVTNVKQLHRMAELGGTPIPEKISKLFSEISEDPDAVRKAGVDLATKLCAELIAMKVPGLHFYTMNTASATLEIYKNLGLPSRG